MQQGERRRSINLILADMYMAKFYIKMPFIVNKTMILLHSRLPFSRKSVWLFIVLDAWLESGTRLHRIERRALVDAGV
jgi:hypothetical protein